MAEKPAFSQVLKSPADFLKQAIGHKVNVKLNSGIEYVGKLVCVDGYMNIAMEEVREHSKENKSDAKYHEAFIRGSNGKFLKN